MAVNWGPNFLFAYAHLEQQKDLPFDASTDCVSHSSVDLSWHWKARDSHVHAIPAGVKQRRLQTHDQFLQRHFEPLLRNDVDHPQIPVLFSLPPREQLLTDEFHRSECASLPEKFQWSGQTKNFEILGRRLHYQRVAQLS
mmetsp:Transcript_44198/g.51087  ORF Transcript_44198/g.51087 Transcript_44198/m.51087 type:complete len:140 (+) Transcript_44198:38-457(+)